MDHETIHKLSKTEWFFLGSFLGGLLVLFIVGYSMADCFTGRKDFAQCFRLHNLEECEKETK